MPRGDPREARRRLYEIARVQGGYFTAAQAQQAGYSRRVHHYHVQRGNWVRIERAIYRLPEWPAVEHEDLIRWTLWSGGKAVVSHDMAMAVHELGDVLPAKVHLTVPRSFRKRAGGIAILYRSSLSPEDIEERYGFRVTTPLRTILDAARAAMDVERLSGAVRDAVQRGLVTRGRLSEALRRLTGSAADRLRAAVKEAQVES